MALASFDFFVPIEPYVLALGGGLDTLTVDGPCRRLGETPLAAALDLTELGHHPLPHPGSAPAPKVAVDRLPRPKIFGQHAPLAARLVHVQHPIDHPPQRTRGASPASRRPRVLGEQRMQDVPLRISDVCFILTSGTHRSSSYRDCVCW